jgi:hypothetical protein
MTERPAPRRFLSACLATCLATCLVLALCLGGIGRGFAAGAPEGSARIEIAGVAISLCARDGLPASQDAHHDCDLCALASPAAPADPPPGLPLRLALAIGRAAPPDPAAIAVRPVPSPLPRGPPSA